MKKNLKRVLSLLLFGAMLAGCFHLADSALRIQTDPFFAYKRELDKNSLDLMFVGSSHAYCSVLPMQLWNDYGCASFVYGTSAQSLPNSYHIIRQELKAQSPSVIILEMYRSFASGDIGNKQEHHRSLDKYPLSIDKIVAVNDLIKDPRERIQYYVPFYLYHSRWNELGMGSFDKSYDPIYAVSGGAYITDPKCVPFEAPALVEPGQYSQIDDVNKEYLEKIVQLCKEKGVKLVLYTAPFMATAEEQRLAQGIAPLAEAYGLEYYNFLAQPELIGLDYGRDMWDSNHLDLYGMEKLTSFFGENIVRREGLGDHRGEAAYESWNKEGCGL